MTAREWGSDITQITTTELLDDPLYAQWFRREPASHTDAGWRVLLQKDLGGVWFLAEVDDWKDGLKTFDLYLPDAHDIVLNNRVWGFKPPVTRVKGRKGTKWYFPPAPLDHLWCEHCRRPSVFQYYSRHHALPERRLAKKLRCSTCGISLDALRRYVNAEEI